MAEYDTYAREFSDHRAGASLNRLIEEPLIHELIGDPRGLRVLDAGCGDGSYAKWLAERGAVVSGFDASAPLIELAKEHCPSADLRTHDITVHLPYEDASFDIVLSTLVMEYVKDLTAVFAQLARVLTRSGRLIVSVDHPLLAGIVKNERGERVLTDYFGRHPRTYSWFGRTITVESHTLEDYAQAILSNGLRIVSVSEPTPTDDASDLDPVLADRASKIPTILVFDSMKE